MEDMTKILCLPSYQDTVLEFSKNTISKFYKVMYRHYSTEVENFTIMVTYILSNTNTNNCENWAIFRRSYLENKRVNFVMDHSVYTFYVSKFSF